MSNSGLEVLPIVPDLGHLKPFYIALHIAGGQVGLPALVATCLFSKTVLRHPTLVNFFSTWVIHSVACCLLLYSGEVGAATSPGSLCFAQSALLHGTLPMCATATLILVVQAWSMFHYPELGSQKWLLSTSLVVKLALPYIILLTFTITTTVLQHHNPGYVASPTGLYCSYYKDPYRRFGVTLYCIVVLILILFIEIAIGIRYFYTWKQISTVFPLANRNTSPALAVRLTLFNLYSLVCLGAGITFVSNTPRSWPYMIQAGMPLAVVLVFGTQKDFFLAWCFWKRKRKGEVPECTFRCPRLDSVADLLRLTPSPSIVPSLVPSIVPTPSIATNSQNNIELPGV